MNLLRVGKLYYWDCLLLCGTWNINLWKVDRLCFGDTFMVTDFKGFEGKDHDLQHYELLFGKDTHRVRFSKLDMQHVKELETE